MDKEQLQMAITCVRYYLFYGATEQCQDDYDKLLHDLSFLLETLPE